MKSLYNVLAGLVSVVLLTGAAAPATAELPSTIDGGAWPAGHVQGIAIDKKHENIYYSFTTMLVRTDLEGHILGTVTGFTGHLGDLDFNEKDGRVYGSLEYKEAESFYIAIFDVDKITEMDMNAETDGIVTTVYLKEVVEDFTADMDGNGVFDGNIGNTADHRYGSSGIDGVSFGPEFGRKHGKQNLMVAYGIYSNTAREDNNYQVILQYDVSQWKMYEKQLTQAAPHTNGPTDDAGKYFVYTGNTTYGVQNLEYDESSGNWLLGVYKGKKEHFPNNSLYIINGSAQPEPGLIAGQTPEENGLTIPLLQAGTLHEESGVCGWDFTADVGIEALGDGLFYVVEQGRRFEDGMSKQTAKLHLFKWTGAVPAPFERVRD